MNRMKDRLKTIAFHDLFHCASLLTLFIHTHLELSRFSLRLSFPEKSICRFLLRKRADLPSLSYSFRRESSHLSVDFLFNFSSEI